MKTYYENTDDIHMFSLLNRGGMNWRQIKQNSLLVHHSSQVSNYYQCKPINNISKLYKIYKHETNNSKVLDYDSRKILY